jgi:glycosyltransferase involved in cell wall biosynthesis
MALTGVTIAIPNWNHEIMLPRSIASAMRAIDVFRGRGVPAEVIVVDDDSRDGSSTLLRRLEALYYKRGFRLLAFGANAGLSATRNQALAHARYRYIAFLDADNELVPENLPLFVEALEKTRAAAAYGNLLIRGPSADRAHNVLSNESVQHKMFQGNYVDAFSVFDRVQLLDVGGYETTFERDEDDEMWLHLATNGRRIVFVPAVLGYYYTLPAAMTLDTRKHHDAQARLRRIYDQAKARRHLRLNTSHLRYHPSLGII